MFPKLRPGQFAVIIAEMATGIILNRIGTRWCEGQPISFFHVFDKYEADPPLKGSLPVGRGSYVCFRQPQHEAR